MSKPQLLVWDTLDDRKTLFLLLGRLKPRARVEFLSWCCKQATLPASKRSPAVQPKTWELARIAERDDSADEKLTFDLFFDLWALVAQFRFDLNVAANRLVQVVRAAERK